MSGTNTLTEADIGTQGHNPNADPALGQTDARDEAAMRTIDELTGRGTPPPGDDQDPASGTGDDDAGDASGDTQADETDDAGASPDGGEKPTEKADEIPDQLLAAARFAGIDEEDLRDALAMHGVEKTTRQISRIVERQRERWGAAPDGVGHGQTGAPTPPPPSRQPAPPPQTPPAGAPDPLDALADDGWGKELADQEPVVKPIVEAARSLAKANRDIRRQLAEAQASLAEVRGQSEHAMASDLYDFYTEVGKTFPGYGKLSGTPTPEALQMRRTLVMAAREYQQRSPYPIRFRDAIRYAHAALTIGQQSAGATGTNPTNSRPAAPQGASPAPRPRGDLTPRSPGMAGKPRTDEERDRAALQTLRKFGVT